MNTEAILDKLVSHEPQSTKEKYIFLVGDDEHLYHEIMAAHYIAIQLSAEQLLTYMNSKRQNASNFKEFSVLSKIKDFIWVPCMNKNSNDSLITFFEREASHISRGGEWLSSWETHQHTKP